jgi:hypothetical protein
MKTPNSILLALMGSVSFILSGCPQPEVIPEIGPPLLEAESPFDLEESPKGISVRKTWVLKNTGDSKMRVTDFELEPDDGIFTVGISRLPFNIERGEEKEITVTFRPTAEQAYTAELSLGYNHGQVFTPDPLELAGLGISNLVCLACEPPPEPECRLDGEVSVYFKSATSTDCENEDGICSYLMFEDICEDGLCDEDTQQCPRPEGWDAGVSWVDAGQPAFDAGMTPFDSGHDPIEPVLCLENEYVLEHLCEPCPAGTTNPAGDDASGEDTTCDATLCDADQYVLSNVCEACPAGSTNAAEDDASGSDTNCDATLCGTDQYVLSNACETCPAGSTNLAGDNASTSDTGCDATLCSTDQYVLNHLCTPCSGSDTNVAGDDASGTNTACDPDACIGIECGENATCNSNNNIGNLCECLPGYQDNNDDGDCVLSCDDTDLDDICNNVDNCPAISNSGQENFDGDSLGDVCDPQSYYHEDDIAFLEEFASNCGLSHWSEFAITMWTSSTTGFEDRPKGRLLDFIHYGTGTGSVSGPQLTCEIPASIGNAVELWRFIVANNNLYGSIPPGIGNLSQLVTVQLNNNDLSGEIPDDLCNTSSYVSLGDNQLCPTYPTCLTSSQIGTQDTTNCN